MKNQVPHRDRSITTLLLIATVIFAGCDSASQPSNSPPNTEQRPQSSTDASSADNSPLTPETDSDAQASAVENTSPTASEDTSATPSADKTAESSVEAPTMSSDAFRMAALEGRTADVKRGLDSGIDIEAINPSRKHTALHMAAFNGHTPTVLFLIKEGAKIDCRDLEGKTPLIHACTGPYPKTVEALIKAGADVNAKGSTEGFTPLMMAAGLNQPAIVEILLANGADKEAVDQDNDKAIDHARRAGLSEITKLLE